MAPSPARAWDGVYNGAGDIVWRLVAHKPLQRNVQYSIPCSRLRELMEVVPVDRWLARKHAKQGVADDAAGRDGLE